jgi:hypothetical protein
MSFNPSSVNKEVYKQEFTQWTTTIAMPVYKCDTVVCVSLGPTDFIVGWRLIILGGAEIDLKPQNAWNCLCRIAHVLAHVPLSIARLWYCIQNAYT